MSERGSQESMLKGAEVGARTGDLARRHAATIYNWNARYDGLEVAEAKGCERSRMRM